MIASAVAAPGNHGCLAMRCDMTSISLKGGPLGGVYPRATTSLAAEEMPPLPIRPQTGQRGEGLAHGGASPDRASRPVLPRPRSTKASLIIAAAAATLPPNS